MEKGDRAEVFATDELLRIDRRSAGLSRRLSKELKQRLDPEGVHVVGATFLHRASGGRENWRYWVLMKLTDQDDPAGVWFDTPLDERPARIYWDGESFQPDSTGDVRALERLTALVEQVV